MDELDIVPCGILRFSDDGKILWVNATLNALLGYNGNALAGKAIDTIFTPATRIFYNTHFFPLIKLQSRADEIFLTLISRIDKAIPVLTNAVRRETAAGVENIAVFMPVFERKKYEHEILEARRAAENSLSESKELQRLAEGLELHARALERRNQEILSVNEDMVQFNKIVSHDLQEPIRKIRLYSERMMRSHAEARSERERMTLERIGKLAERLSLLTAGLQQYVNVQNAMAPAAVSLNDCLSAAVARIQESWQFYNFEVSADQLPSVEGFRSQLELLFYHLLDNSIQYRKPDEPLKITVTHTLFQENVYRSIPDRYQFVDHVRMIFSDNGVGFDNQYKDYVFDFGRRMHAGDNGIGIGLALIRKVVVNHGGTISIESEEGKGTHVIILLPLRLVHLPPPAQT